LKLTRHTDYALRVLMFLALQKNERLVTVSDIADHFDIPRNHLVKIVHQLGQLAYVCTVRGKGGGMRLGRPAGSIGIGEVVRDVETTLEVVNCLQPECPLLPDCSLRGVLHEARDAFIGVLDKYTLVDLVARPRKMQTLLQWHPVKAV